MPKVFFDAVKSCPEYEPYLFFQKCDNQIIPDRFWVDMAHLPRQTKTQYLSINGDAERGFEFQVQLDRCRETANATKLVVLRYD